MVESKTEKVNGITSNPLFLLSPGEPGVYFELRKRKPGVVYIYFPGNPGMPGFIFYLDENDIERIAWYPGILFCPGIPISRLYPDIYGIQLSPGRYCIQKSKKFFFFVYILLR